MKSEIVHEFFGLSYASYLVLPRVLMQEMPERWQREMVALLEEMDDHWDYHEDDYMVKLRGEDGRFKADPLAQYRRPDWDLIEALRIGRDDDD